MTDTLETDTLAEVQAFDFPLSGAQLDRWNELHGEAPAKIPAIVSQEDLAALMAKLAALEGKTPTDDSANPVIPPVH